MTVAIDEHDGIEPLAGSMVVAVATLICQIPAYKVTRDGRAVRNRLRRSRARCANFSTVPPKNSQAQSGKSEFSRHIRQSALAWRLLSSWVSVIVIRAAFLLTLTLTVATGESATLVCQAFCDRAPVADGDACHHAQPAAPVSLTNVADCTSVGLPAMATPRAELNPSDSDDFGRVAVSNEPSASTFGRSFAAAVFSLSAGSPPRTIALRI